MKKKILIVLSLILIISLCLITAFMLYKDKQKDEQEKNEQARYLEIKEIVKKGVEKNLRATHPNCPIVDELPENNSVGFHYNSSYLINNGYIKQKDLLDYDGESFCDIYVEIKTYKKNQFDSQKDCNVSYELYLKCNNYEEKGYQNWG